MTKIFLVLLIMLSGLQAENMFEIKSGVIEYEMAGGDEMGNVKVLFNDYGNKMRMMMKRNDIDMEMYTIFNSGLAYAINDNQKIFMKSSIDDMPFAVGKNFENLTPTNTETVIGKSCKVYNVEGDKFWLWKGIVLKAETKTGENLTALSVQEVSTPSTAFNIPKDYSEMKIPDGF